MVLFNTVCNNHNVTTFKTSKYASGNTSILYTHNYIKDKLLPFLKSESQKEGPEIY